jgi:hypothetical protein
MINTRGLIQLQKLDDYLTKDELQLLITRRGGVDTTQLKADLDAFMRSPYLRCGIEIRDDDQARLVYNYLRHVGQLI